MKKLILLLALCFGVFLCQNVIAQTPATLPNAQQALPQNVQLVNPQNTSFDKEATTPGVGLPPQLLVNTANTEFSKLTKKIENSNPDVSGNVNLSRLPLVNSILSKKALIPRTK